MAVRTLSKELQKKAEAEINEVPSNIKDDIDHIRTWLKQQPHLLNVVTDDQWILNFLRGCKFSFQKTKEKLDLYYTMKAVLSEFYFSRDPSLPENQEILKLGLLLPLPKTAQPDGPRIIINRCDTVDPTKISFEAVIKIYLMIVDIMIKEDDNFIIAGQHVLVELKGMSIKHALGISPSTTKKLVICLQDAYPTRLKGFHILNMPSYFETLFGLVKQLLSEKNKRRIYLFNKSNIQDMYKFIPPTILPKEYGGEGSTLNELTDYWKNKVEAHREWFLNEEKCHSNESLRSGKAKISNDVFGLEGSFRKLDLD